MDPENKQFVVCDDKLFKLIGEKRFRAFGFPRIRPKDPSRREGERERERETEREEIESGGDSVSYARVHAIESVFSSSVAPNTRASYGTSCIIHT